MLESSTFTGMCSGRPISKEATFGLIWKPTMLKHRETKIPLAKLKFALSHFGSVRELMESVLGLHR